MTTLPNDYDTWRLSAPEHPDPEMQECDQCDGTGTHLRDEHDTGTACHICGGSGEVPRERDEEYADGLGDYLYERKRDMELDNE